MSESMEDPIIDAEEATADDEASASSSMLYIFLAYGLALSLAVGGAVYYFFIKSKKKKKPTVTIDDAAATNSVGMKDIAYLANKLHPNSTHMDVLYAVATTPESVAYSLRTYAAYEKVREDRRKQDEEEAKKLKGSSKSDKPENELFSFEDDDGGWADDEDEEDEEIREKAKLAKQLEEQKKKDREQLDKAVGKTKIKLEGFNDGVIGQKWVEGALASQGVWPPKDLRFLKDMTFEYNGKQLSVLDHPGLRRNILMTTGRLNSIMLNSHPELLEAGSKQLIDQTYFRGSMDFRGRCGLLLEAALRTAVAVRNDKLTKTIVEAVGMFKIGCTSPDKVEWFDGIMQKQYECLPRLKIENTYLECPDEKEMATGDMLSLGLDLTREHAESFTRQKIAMFKKQGIPPQVALQTYREGWWFLVHAERLDGETPASVLDLKVDGLLKEADKGDIEKFEKATFEERLVTAWPMIVQNVAQKSGKVKIQFFAPSVPGKYKFTVSVKSQDFLGADQEFSSEGTIVDASTVVRKPKEEKKGEEKETTAEDDKKDK